MRKLYIVYSTEADFKLLMSKIISVGNVHSTDYSLIARKRVAEMLGEISAAYSTDPKTKSIVSKIIDISVKYNDIFYEHLIEWLNRWSGNRERVFVRSTDFRIINKLKRRYKRSNYITVLLTDVKPKIDFKFDIIIRTNDNFLLEKEFDKFVKTRLYTMHFINTKKLDSKHGTEYKQLKR